MLARIVLTACRMMRAISISTLILFIVTGVPLPAYAAPATSVVVAAARAGDAPSAEAATAVRQALALVSGYHVIDRAVAQQVIDYYGDQKAATTFPTARTPLARAQDHYLHMHFDDARAEVGRARDTLERDPASLADKGQLLFDILMTQGMIAHALKDEALMDAAFARAAALSPTTRVDTRAYAPSIVKAFEAQRARLAGAGTGALNVQSDPEVADVYLNGIGVGVTPLTLTNIPAGSYVLSLRANKYREEIKNVQIASGKNLTINEKLAWSGGSSTANRKDAGRAEIDEALRIAELMKADRAVLVAAEEKNGAGMLGARVVDRQYRAAMRPVMVRYDTGGRAAAYAELTDELVKSVGIDPASDPASYADPQGTADPRLLGKNKKKIYRQPLFWGAIGVAAAGAIAGGVLAATSGGGGGDGSVRVQFK